MRYLYAVIETELEEGLHALDMAWIRVTDQDPGFLSDTDPVIPKVRVRTRVPVLAWTIKFNKNEIEHVIQYLLNNFFFKCSNYLHIFPLLIQMILKFIICKYWNKSNEYYCILDNAPANKDDNINEKQNW